MEKIDSNLLESIADLHEIPAGAYNIRKNGELSGRQSTENITYGEENKYTSMMLLDAINQALEKAKLP